MTLGEYRRRYYWEQTGSGVGVEALASFRTVFWGAALRGTAALNGSIRESCLPALLPMAQTGPIKLARPLAAPDLNDKAH
jgi:hypothetical protein